MDVKWVDSMAGKSVDSMDTTMVVKMAGCLAENWVAWKVVLLVALMDVILVASMVASTVENSAVELAVSNEKKSKVRQRTEGGG